MGMKIALGCFALLAAILLFVGAHEAYQMARAEPWAAIVGGVAIVAVCVGSALVFRDTRMEAHQEAEIAKRINPEPERG